VTGEATRGLIDTNIVVHLAELSAGPHHTEDPVERARRISVLQHTEATFDPLPFDAEAARTYGMVCAAVLPPAAHGVAGSRT
jgi:hypothetical protein